MTTSTRDKSELRTAALTFARWAVPSAAASLPISMAPLMYVFVTEAATGDFALGALVVGVFVVGELLGASTVGVINRLGSVKSRLAWGYIASATAFGAVALAPTMPLHFLLVAAFASGFAPAASPGTLQAVLLSSIVEDAIPRILVAARVLSTVVFMAGPAVVGMLAFTAEAWAAPTVCAVAMVLAAVGLLAVPNSDIATDPKVDVRSTLKIVWSIWPLYTVGLAAAFVVSLVDLVIAPLLVQRGEPAGLVGPIAACFFAFGLGGSIVYGARKRWPGSYATQSLIVTVLMVIGLCIAALIPSVAGIAFGVFLAGSGVAVLMMIRTLSLRAVLPADMHAAAFSLNYAMSCLGYILCALIGGTSLAAGAPSGALLIGAFTILTLGVAASVFERSLMKKRAQAELNDVVSNPAA